MNRMTKSAVSESLEIELQKLIAFRSVTGEHASTRALLEYMHAELRKLGIQSEIRARESFSYLIAGTQSLEHSKVLLQAHVDVVPAPDNKFAMRQVGDRLLGRGAYDMLFAPAVFLVALRQVSQLSKLPMLDIGVMLSSDEEIGGFKTAKPVIDAYDCDVCFLPDAGGKDTLSTSAKGVLQLEITFAGKSGHAGRPHEYDNPILKLVAFIGDLHGRFPNSDPTQTVCSLTTVTAGQALNQVPDTARMTVDIRYVPSDKPELLEREVLALAKRHNGEVREVVREPAFRTNHSNPFVRQFIEIHESFTGRSVSYMSAPGSSDARFFTKKGVPVIMTRPEGGGLHAPDEWVSLTSLTEYTKILRAYLLQAGQPNTLIEKHR